MLRFRAARPPTSGGPKIRRLLGGQGGCCEAKKDKLLDFDNLASPPKDDPMDLAMFRKTLVEPLKRMLFSGFWTSKQRFRMVFG